MQCAGTLLALLYRRLLFSIAKVWHDEIRDKNNMLAGRILIVPIRGNVLKKLIHLSLVVVVMLRQVSLWVAVWNAFSVECSKTAASCKQTPLSNVLRSLSHFLSEAHPLFFALSLYPNVLFWLELPSGYADMGVVGHNTHEVLSNFSRLCREGPERSSCMSFMAAPVRNILPEDSDARGVISVKMPGFCRICLSK